MGKNGLRQAYRAAMHAGLTGIICVVLAACAAAPVARPGHPPAPHLMADDLALFERFQAEYALQGGDRDAADGAALNLRSGGAEAVEDHVDLAGDEIGHGRTRAAIGDVADLRLGEDLEQLADEMSDQFFDIFR